MSQAPAQPLRSPRPARRPLRLCLGLLSALTLAACAGPPAGEEGRSGARAPEAAGDRQAAAPLAAGPREAGATTLSTADPSRDRPPEVAALPPLDDDPDQFLGLSGPGVSERLGAPALVRRDRDAEVWQYRSARCVVDLFLYAEEDGPLTVRHAEIRNPALTKGERRACLAAMLRAVQRRQAGS